MRDRTGKWIKGESGNKATRFGRGNAHAWKRGSSGNPAGVPRQQRQVREGFAEALLNQGGLDEVAAAVWEAARHGESWALIEICRRLEPEAAERDKPAKAAPFGPGQAADEDIDARLAHLFREYEIKVGEWWAKNSDLDLDKLTTDEQVQFLGLVAKLKAQPGEVLRWKPGGEAMKCPPEGGVSE